MHNDSSDPEKSFDELPRAALTRRGFIQTAVATIGGLAAPLGAAEAAAPARPSNATPVAAAVPVLLRINGREHRLNLEPRVTLLDALREVVGLTGAKKGCDRGQCGACTVHVDGRRVVSCLTLAATLRGKRITTIEGLPSGEELHPVQQAFVDCDALQCGFCTPGQVMSAAAVIREGHARTDDEIKEAMSGNICRCGAYPNILAAIKQAGGGA
jgi:xanthine dehydrogenase YagT iron-sulfur-binding subunit